MAELMQYGFTDYRGNTWGNASVDTYNRFNEQVFKREKLNPVRGTMAFDELEFYRDQRHKCFEQLAEIAASPKQKLIPSFKAITRLKRAYRKHGLPDSQLNSLLRAAFKKRGGMWFSSQLSWYK